jgi:hypothetical protein
MDKDEFKFPDEIEDKDKPLAEGGNVEEQFEYEVEDDTPIEDRGREPMPKEVVEELEQDELEEYSDKVKLRLKQMKKVWHDERRAKETAYREQQEAVTLAKRVMEENERLKKQYTAGEKEYAETVKGAAEMQLEMAKKAYKEAYDSGDADQIVEAQQAMQEANIRLMQAKSFRPNTVQERETDVQRSSWGSAVDPPRPPDQRAMAWQERNPWFGQDEEMTATALGLHEKLKRNGVPVGSDDYYATLDKTIRKRFPEQFETTEVETKVETPRTKPSTVVAPATRSTAPKKVKLKQSQMDTIKKLGITPEQYVREFMKLENANG